MVCPCQVPEPQCIFTRNDQTAFLFQKGGAKGSCVLYILAFSESGHNHKVK